MDRQVTIRDIAEVARVHPSTVSRALNSEGAKGLVSRATIQRITVIARELGYQPNAMAQGLKINRTMTIGMIIPDLTNSIFPPMARGIEDVLRDHGYTLLIANTDNDPEKEQAVVSAMARRRADGLIVATAHRSFPMLDQMLAGGQPVVLVNRVAERATVPSVTGDDHEGIALAVRHLVELGHTRIAHLAGTKQVSTGLIRYQSFLNSMETAELEVDPALVVWCPWFTEEHGAAAFTELLERDAEFTAVIAANDRVAMGIYDVAAERGLRIPDDIAVVGYNDSAFADRLTPSLTSVRVPYYQLGVKAAELVLETLADPQAQPVSVRLRPQLMVRGSTTGGAGASGVADLAS